MERKEINGKVLSRECFYSHGNVIIENVFKGKYKIRIESKYNKDNELIKESRYYIKETEKEVTKQLYSIIEYNDEGKLIEESGYNKETGIIEFRKKYDSHKILFIDYDKDGQISHTEVYT